MTGSRNYHAAMLAFTVAGLAMQSMPQGPKARAARLGLRLGRRVEYKDVNGDIADALKQINAAVAGIGERLKVVEGNQTEFKSFDGKSLAADVAALKADLKAAREASSGVDFKSFEAKFTALGNQLTEAERKINDAVVNSSKLKLGPRERKSFASVESLDKAMRAGEIIEFKSLDSDLKQQDIFHDDLVIGDYPLLEMAFRRPTRADKPKFSFPVAGAVTVKGEAAGASGSRKKVELSVVQYEYQPTLDRADVEDAGALLLDDEMNSMVDGSREKLNADLVDAVESAAAAPTTPGFDQYTDVALYETAGAAWTDADLDTLVSHLDVKYRRGAVFVGNAAMVATLRNIRDAATGVSMWQPSMAAGTPPTLKGYAFIEDANVADGRLIFGNPRRGLAIAERETATLSNIERSGGDYKPYYAARFARGVFDARALKVMDEAAAT